MDDEATRSERREKKLLARRQMKVHNAARWKMVQEAQQKRAQPKKKS